MDRRICDSAEARLTAAMSSLADAVADLRPENRQGNTANYLIGKVNEAIYTLDRIRADVATIRAVAT